MASLLKSISRWWKGPPKPINPSIEPDPERCLNCGIDLSSEDRFCHKCGQRNRHQKLTINELILETAVNFFGYDSKLWYTLKHIWLPGRAAQLFQAGKRASLVHPTRLFFFSFLVLVFISQRSVKKFDIFSSEQSPVAINIDSDSSAVADLKKDSITLDSIKFATLGSDSVSLEQLVEDSLKVTDLLGVSDSISLRIIHGLDSIERIRVSEEYITDTPQDTIFKELGLEDTWKNKVARQQIKFYKDRGAYNRFLISSVVWMLLLLQPFIALFLKIILYRWYYSDHLVWSVYLFSSIFLLLILYQCCITIFEWTDIQANSDTFLEVTITIGLIYSYLSIKMFYKKGFIKSFFIFCYLSLATFMVLLLFLIANLAISFVLF
jgi:hypothetical protein